MFERIIVALDGSASSEAALPAAAELARRLGSSIILLHVLERRPPRAVHGERHLAEAKEAEAYLASVAARLAEEGVAAGLHVHAAAAGVAAAVAAHESEFHNDLAIMSAHGRHGPARLLSGSLPLKVASGGGAAVLLVPPSSAEARAFAPRRVVLPLDGRPEHEAALPAAASLARAFGAPALLVAAVPRDAAEAGGAGAAFARLAPALSGASLEYAAEGSAAYLREVAARLASEGVRASSLVLRGRPARAVVAACGPGDLLVLSTHRKLGLDASLDGCVAFEAARRWRGALLVVPVPRP